MKFRQINTEFELCAASKQYIPNFPVFNRFANNKAEVRIKESTYPASRVRIPNEISLNLFQPFFVQSVLPEDIASPLQKYIIGGKDACQGKTARAMDMTMDLKR